MWDMEGILRVVVRNLSFREDMMVVVVKSEGLVVDGGSSNTKKLQLMMDMAALL